MNEPLPYRAPRPALVGPGILVVEDEVGILGLLDLVLQHVGLRVFKATTADKALDLLRAHQEVVETALLDMHMPDVNGQRLLRSIHSVKPTLSCCFMTGDPSPRLRDELLASGAVKIFQKPFDVMALAKEMRELAGRRVRA